MEHQDTTKEESRWSTASRKVMTWRMAGSARGGVAVSHQAHGSSSVETSSGAVCHFGSDSHCCNRRTFSQCRLRSSLVVRITLPKHMSKASASVLALQPVRSVPRLRSLPLYCGYGSAPSQCGERASAAGHCCFRPARVARPASFLCCSLSCDAPECVPGTFSLAVLCSNLFDSANLLL